MYSFKDIVRCSELSATGIAKYLEIPLPTVKAWSSGKTLPAGYLLKLIFHRLLDDGKIKMNYIRIRNMNGFQVLSIEEYYKSMLENIVMQYPTALELLEIDEDSEYDEDDVSEKHIEKAVNDYVDYDCIGGDEIEMCDERGNEIDEESPKFNAFLNDLLQCEYVEKMVSYYMQHIS